MKLAMTLLFIKVGTLEAYIGGNGFYYDVDNEDLGRHIEFYDYKVVYL